MSQLVGEGVVHVTLDDRDVNSQMSKVGKDGGKQFTSGFAGSLKGLAAVAGGALVGAKVISFAKASIAEARESQKVSATTTQIIKSTGGAAKITANAVGNLSTAISNKAGVDDEAIQSGANLLLTFTGVRNEVGKGNDVFNQATQAAVDLSAAGFGSITGASVQLGKALNDPLKGISALARSGVTFTAQQQDQIKALVASGHTLEAQKIILKGVQEQVGGVAAASATMGEKSAVAFGNIKEAIGTALLPALDAAEGFFVKKIAPAIFKVIALSSQIGPTFRRLRGDVVSFFSSNDTAGGILDTVQTVLPQIVTFVQKQLIPALLQIGQKIPPVLQVIVGFVQTQLIPALVSIGKQVIPVLQTASNTFRTVVLPAIIGLVSYVVANLLPILGQIAQIVVTQIIPTLAKLAIFIYGTVYPAIIKIVQAVAHNLKPVFDTLVQVIKVDILPVVAQLVTIFREQLLPALEPLIVKIVKVVGVVLKLASAILGKVLPPLLKLVGFILLHVLPIIAKLIVIVIKIIDKVVGFGIAVVTVIAHFVKFNKAVIDLVVGAVSKVVEAVTGLPGAILGLGPKMLHAGAAIIGKFIDGLKNAGGAAKGIVGGIWNALKGLINNAIDGINNALEFSISIGFGKHLSINAPDIPHLARGTNSFVGGFARVGEEGPEDVLLPRGSRVFTARDSAAAGAGVYIASQTVVAHDYQDFVGQSRRTSQQAALGGRRNPR